MDTSAWVALVDARDDHHGAAAAEMKRLRKGEALVTSDYVFDETVTRLRKTSGHDAAVRFGDALRTSTLTRLVGVGPEDLTKAWSLFVKRPDKDLSFTDCTTVVLVERLGAGAVFTFDRDFEKLGLETRPGSRRLR